ncbi:MAG TPA: sortase [Naasia sp.]
MRLLPAGPGARHRASPDPLRLVVRRPTLAVGALLALAVTGVAFDTAWHVPEPPAAAAEPVAGRAPAAEPAAVRQDPQAYTEAAQPPAAGVVPTRVRVPDIGIDAELVDLVRDADGVLLPPPGLASAGWFTGSAVPGAVGPAVLAGHVDDTSTAGVFSRLRELAPGAEILVTLSDGSERRFLVDRTVDVAKAEFPTDAVYGPVPNAQLRLITCNGPYDFAGRHYRNNLVVFAVPA